jgi:hypothetical protein
MIRSSEAETAPCFLPENFFPAANLHTEIVKSQWVKMHTNGLPGYEHAVFVFFFSLFCVCVRVFLLLLFLVSNLVLSVSLRLLLR